MRVGLKNGVRVLLLAGALGVGCNSLVGNDTHQLDPTVGNPGTAGAHTGGGSGQLGGSAVPAGGANGGGAVATGGVPAAGGGPATGTGGVIANGGASGSGGVVGTGGAGGMCVATGSVCSASTDCCQTSSTTPMGATCISDDGVCHAKCMNASQCVSGCCVPVKDETYGVCADATIYCPALKGVGDPCSADSECASGSCNDWCQATCGVGNSSCDSTPSRPSNSQDQTNSCVLTQANTYSCFPGCVTNSDCSVYGTSYTCQIVSDVDGYYAFVCSL